MDQYTQKRTITWIRYFLQVLLTACMYFILARVSLLLQFESSNATPVWPSSGLAFALTLLWGVRIIPGILFGAFAANFLVFVTNQTVDYPTAAWLSLIIAIGNTGEAVAGNFMLKKFVPHFNLETFLDKVEDVLRYSLIAALMCIVSSIIGVTTVYVAGIIPSSQFGIVWLTWWMGDFSGILLVTTFMLVWFKSFNQHGRELYDYKKLQTETILFFITVLLTGLAIWDNHLTTFSLFKWAYWIIPVIVWAALRLSQREVITALVIYSVIAIWGTVHHQGPFSYVPLYEALLALQSFIAIMVITKLTLNASVLERKKTVLILRKTGSELEMRVKKRTAQLESSEQELREKQALLEDRNKALQKTNEELSSFAYVASHDLQEPLRKIQIFSKRIIDSELDTLSESGKDFFGRMKSAAERMQLLIEDLLTYSRTGSLTRKFEKTNLHDIIDEVKENLRDELLQKNAVVTANEMCECKIIPFQFRQLIHNLFSNSLKFSKEDRPPHIEVKCTIKNGAELHHPALDPDKEYCHIVVTDNGIGFDPKFNDQIFGLFQRLHGKSEYPGTGIGLSICRKIIENHDGIITAHGEPGKGATFNIYIPN